MKTTLLSTLILGAFLFSFQAIAYEDGYVETTSGGSWHMRWTAGSAPDSCGTNCYEWDLDSPYCADVDALWGYVGHSSAWYLCNWFYTKDDGDTWPSNFDDFNRCNELDFDGTYWAEARDYGHFSSNNLCNKLIIKINIKPLAFSTTYTQRYVW